MIIFTEYHSRIVAAKCDWWEVSEPDDEKHNMGYIANKIDCLANGFFFACKNSTLLEDNARMFKDDLLSK